MLNGKVMIIYLIVRLIKKTSFYKMSYFLEAYSRSQSKIKGELNLSNYPTKSNLKHTTPDAYLCTRFW